ncbi:Na+/H+ antiporter NhaA [Sphingomonas sp. RG327]|jgi:NhaA family Na+:H+ antiporter|uniref:Na(+)/H(+) antiporter NhaA n=1 Tax=Sphingomonas anseongensis TaxID=2908207 RepID=A0ABT0RG58_9SPHN|nr:Na+/H+ antiporter NhaA [Sphingomonas anseongensis]MCL6679275.1 Na+/H+ antiporter NhaA [Sphingomonas anseongensis]
MASGPDEVQSREKLAGIFLMAAAAAALLIANSGLAGPYHSLLETRLGPALPRLGVLSLHEWIADGLMAVFFLLVGLEVKREWYDGRLSTAAERRLPIIAAAAGMAVPAMVYLAVTGADPAVIRGWAIPSATDIAFAVGILALLGKSANPSLKLVLVAIAVIDDIGAVIIIALVYTASLDAFAIAAAVAIVGLMAMMNLLGVRRLFPYMIAFVALWVAMLASGVHATISGVLAALTIPLGRGEEQSPLKRLEHAIHPWVMLGIMPLFGLASAGVHIGGFGEVLQPVPLAIIAGLFIGKQAGVFGSIWLMVRLGIATRKPSTPWIQIYGAALLTGVGFTMSLFIGALAFNDPDLVDSARLGTIVGSLLAGLAGWAVLYFSKPFVAEDDRAEAREIFAGDFEGGTQGEAG